MATTTTLSLKEILSGIASAIRTMKSTLLTFNAQDLPTIIENLDVGPMQSTLLWEDLTTSKTTVSIDLNHNLYDYQYLCFVIYDGYRDVTDHIFINTDNIMRWEDQSDSIPSFCLGNSCEYNSSGLIGHSARWYYFTSSSSIQISECYSDYQQSDTFPTLSVPIRLYGIKGSIANIDLS